MALFKWLAISFFLPFSIYVYKHIGRRLGSRQVIKGHDRSIWLLDEKGTKHHIPDWSTFISMGFGANDIKGVPQEEVDSYPIGDPAKHIEEEKSTFEVDGCPCKNSREETNGAAQIGKLQKLCIVKNGATDAVISKSTSSKHINYEFIESGTNQKDLVGKCDVLIEFTKQANSPVELSCPGKCKPIPYIEVPINVLLPPLRMSTSLTCTMTLATLFGTNDTAALERHMHKKHTDAGGQEHDKLHHMVGFILRAIAQRKQEECKERDYWPKGAWAEGAAHYHRDAISRDHSNTSMPKQPALDRWNHSTVAEHKIRSIPRRKVFGVILWVGSTSRRELGQSQMLVLSNQFNETEDNLILGWFATEDEYPCRVGSTLCEKVTGNMAYFSNMPTTQMHLTGPGWGCAQRRPLRAFSHLLLLFDPEFVLIVDDDTYVSANLLGPGQLLNQFIRGYMSTQPGVMGQLTHGKKITTKGFFYGGAGYLVGPEALRRLTSFTLLGPPVDHDLQRNNVQMHELSLLHQAYSVSQEKCPSDCVRMNKGESQPSDAGSSADISIRVVEMCTNIMAEEHTGYHSDHSLSRCFAHAIYGDILDTPCGGLTLPQPQGGYIAMCMGTDQCGTNVHLTCHRWMPSPLDWRIPMGAAWNSTEENAGRLRKRRL